MLHYFEMCPLISDFFLLIINRESHSVVFVSTNEKRLQNQVYRQIKSKPMDTLDLAKVYRLKGLTSLYIISCLHFLNLNNILTLPKTLVVAEAGFGLTWIMFALFFACQIYTRLRASLLNQSKCKPSIEINICSQDLQEIIIYKTIKKRLYCNQIRIF